MMLSFTTILPNNYSLVPVVIIMVIEGIYNLSSKYKKASAFFIPAWENDMMTTRS